MKNKAKKLILLPLVGMLLIAVACGGDKPEKDKAEKEKPKDEFSDLEQMIDDYCACMEEDPTQCEEEAKATDEKAKNLINKLMEETKDDEEKAKVYMEKVGKLAKQYSDCKRTGKDEKKEE